MRLCIIPNDEIILKKNRLNTNTHPCMSENLSGQNQIILTSMVAIKLNRASMVDHLRLKDIMSLLKLSKSTIYEMMDISEQPMPRHIGKRLVAWPESVIAEWLNGR